MKKSSRKPCAFICTVCAANYSKIRRKNIFIRSVAQAIPSIFHPMVSYAKATMKPDDQSVDTQPASIFSQTVAHAGDCLICYDVNRKIIELNRSAVALYRYSDADILGKPAAILI